MKKTTEWNEKWPTEPGSYWFYGWPYGRTHGFDEKPLPKEELYSEDLCQKKT